MPTKPGYRVFIDISSFKQASRGGNRHWLIVVDEFSDYTHSFFLNKKSDQIKILPMWIKGIAKKHRIEIKRIRLDNSGENKRLQKECDYQKYVQVEGLDTSKLLVNALDGGNSSQQSNKIEDNVNLLKTL